MLKIEQIKANREKRFWKNRMSLAQVKKDDDRQKELMKHVDLISDNKTREEHINLNIKNQLEENKRSRSKVRIY